MQPRRLQGAISPYLLRSTGVRRAVHSPRRGDRPGRRAQAQGSTRVFLFLFCLALESSAVEQGAPTTSAPGLGPLCYVLCAPNARRLSIGMSRLRTCCCAKWRAGGTCAFPTSVRPQLPGAGASTALVPIMPGGGAHCRWHANCARRCGRHREARQPRLHSCADGL